MESVVNMQYVLNALIFSALGVVLLMLAFAIIDLITPHYHVWREIVEKQNTALAILLGSFLLGVAIIIAAAVHS